MMKLVIIIFIILIANVATSQDLFKIDSYSFKFGSNESEVMQTYSEFTYDEYIGDNEDDTQMYFTDTETEVTYLLKFFGGKLGQINVSDEWASGVFSKFSPEDLGFNKIKEESEYINNMFPNVITHLYRKDNYELRVCWGRFGFLEIVDKEINNNYE